MKKFAKFGAGRGVMTATSMAALLVSMPAVFAAEQPTQTAQAVAATATGLEEVVVTGTRVVREGYEAPTPLTVVGAEALQSSGAANVADYVNTMPAFVGSPTSQNTTGSGSAGTAGVNGLSLRSLGPSRTLVLLDGQRSVGSLLDATVDINTFPQMLISRVDVVTAGASAIYGSDAVAGVVNFVLDKQFTGIKGEVAGGMTSYRDNKNYQLGLAGGFGFAQGRGHVLLSGEVVQKDGVVVGIGNRKWGRQSLGYVTNPAYGTGAGQTTTVPQRLLRYQVGIANGMDGGIIATGPLFGTAFGPGGVPYKLNMATLQTAANFVGGDWKATNGILDRAASLDASESRQSVYTRASYDVTDSFSVYASAAWSHSYTFSNCCNNYFYGNAGVIRLENPFIPAETRAQMVSLGLTTITIGSTNFDLPLFATPNDHFVNRYVVGANGTIDMFGDSWSWDTYFQIGRSRNDIRATGVVSRTRYTQAVDAVRHPTTGQIVCRSTLTNPGNGCQPYNLMGIGVTSQATKDWLDSSSQLNQRFLQHAAEGTLRGEPFETWAGPVSVAFNAAYRLEKVNGTTDALSLLNDHWGGNYFANAGKYDVLEGAMEAVVPLAKGSDFAEAWDANFAVRATNYSTSGYVTTWAVGTTYSPVDDLRFRITRSRDIRAPNLGELYRSGGGAAGNLFDPVANAVISNVRSFTTGNPNLTPEIGDTLGLGVVLQPTFLEGFQASVDYWTIKLQEVIGNVPNADILLQCFAGATQFCSLIERNADGSLYQIRSAPINFALQRTRGLDFEMSYSLPLADLSEDWNGNVRAHALLTRYLENYQDRRLAPPVDSVGQNTSGGVPRWRLNATLNYSLDPLSVTLTARAVSSGTNNAAWVACTSGCPVSTANNPTVDDNYLPGGFWLDASMNYKFVLGEETEMEFFFNAKNLLNKDAVELGVFPSPYFQQNYEPRNYDSLGRVYRMGVRFQM